MKNGKTSVIKSITRGTLYAVIASLILVLIFALIIKLTEMSGGVIKPIVQVLKVISVFYGVLVGLKGIEKRGYIWGAVIGLLYTVFAFFIFSILDSNFSITMGLLNDMIFACVIGAVSAVILKFGRRNEI